MIRTARALVVFVLVGAVLGPVLPVIPVAAHCEDPLFLLGMVDTCEIHGPLEDAVLAANEALDGHIAIVLVKDKRFHPEIVTLKSEGSLMFLYADIHQNENHDPKSTPTCGSQEADLARCAPPAFNSPDRALIGKCFDVVRDTGNNLKQVGEYYGLTFQYDEAGERVAKSHGILAGMPGAAAWADPFDDCPPEASSRTFERAVIPFFCAIHGDSHTEDTQMRGAVVVEA